MLGHGALSEFPIAAVDAALAVFSGKVAFQSDSEFEFRPNSGVYAGDLIFEGGSDFAFGGRVRLAGGVSFDGNSDFAFRGRTIASGAVDFEGGSEFEFDIAPRIYAATRDFATLPTDSRPNFPFAGLLDKAIRFDRSILNGTSIGQVTVGWGEMELNNREKDYDYLVKYYAIDGRRVVLKVGELGASYDDFFTIFDLTAKGGHIDEDVFRISLRDHAYKIEVPIQGEIYEGTGNFDGDESLKGRRKPLLLGWGENLTPQELIMSPAVPMYQFSTGESESLVDVFDNAIALTKATVPDYPTKEALLAATSGAEGSGADIEAGEYASCLAESVFRLGGSPIGAITCTAEGRKVDGVYAETTVDIIRQIVSVTDPSARFNDYAMNKTNAQQPAVVGYYLATGSETQTADVVADLIEGIGGWAGYERNGQFSAYIFSLPDDEAPSARYDTVDIVEGGVSREKLPDGMEPPPWRYRVMWGRNWTVQDGLTVDDEVGLTEERIAFLKEEYRVATSDEEQARRIKTDHPLAQDPEIIEAYFRYEADAQAEADRRLDIFSKTLSLYKVTLYATPFVHDIGHVVEIVYPRFDCHDGKKLRIVAISEDTEENDSELIGIG